MYLSAMSHLVMLQKKSLLYFRRKGLEDMRLYH